MKHGIFTKNVVYCPRLYRLSCRPFSVDKIIQICDKEEFGNTNVRPRVMPKLNLDANKSPNSHSLGEKHSWTDLYLSMRSARKKLSLFYSNYLIHQTFQAILNLQNSHATCNIKRLPTKTNPKSHILNLHTNMTCYM